MIEDGRTLSREHIFSATDMNLKAIRATRDDEKIYYEYNYSKERV
jgi:hypothetical protein